jgi:hypothetical protein
MDADPEVHQVLTGKVFPRQADVLTVDEWEARLASAPDATDAPDAPEARAAREAPEARPRVG